MMVLREKSSHDVLVGSSFRRQHECMSMYAMSRCMFSIELLMVSKPTPLNIRLLFSYQAIKISINTFDLVWLLWLTKLKFTDGWSWLIQEMRVLYVEASNL